MTFHEDSKDESCCSFCGKSCRAVGPLIEGAPGFYLCRGCVELCQHIFEIEAIRRGVPAQSESAGDSTADSGQPDMRFRVVGVRADGNPVVLDELPMPRALDMQFRLQMAKVLPNVTIEPIAPQRPA